MLEGEQSKRPARGYSPIEFRWVILTGIVIITVINYVDRGAISYAAEGIMGEYWLDPAEWGNVLGFFGYGYMFGALIGGFLADKKGPKWMWTVATLSWSVLVVGVIFAGDFGIAMPVSSFGRISQSSVLLSDWLKVQRMPR